MIGGVSFQPGSLDQEQQRRQATNGTAQGVQEAIKVLSLRLPKVVGAQAAAPQALLQSPGSGGNSHVDSIVQSVLSKIFPQSGGPAPSAPTLPMQTEGTSHGYSEPAQPSAPSAPTFSGQVESPQRQATSDAPGANDFWKTFPRAPQIIVSEPPPQAPTVIDQTPKWPGLPGVDGSGSLPGNGIGGIVSPAPDLRGYFDWLPGGGGNDSSPMI